VSEVKTTYIRPQEGFQEEFVRSNIDVVFGGGVLGSGKRLSINELVLTPNGWVKNGDLKVGDYVNTPFGNPAKVLNVYDFKNCDCYLLTTSDGRKVECDLEHLWAIRTKKQLQKYREDGDVGRHLTICTTETLIERLKNGQKSYIPIPHAQEFEEKDLPIHPYVLGVLIGDGCLTDKTWVFDTAFCISNTEQDIINKVAFFSETTRVYVQPNCHSKKFYSPKAKAYKEYCQSVGLNTYSYERFIPKEYLFSSIKQRRQLLEGLFDTDGSVAKNGSFRYSTESKKLCDGVVALCRSLGYIVTVSLDNREGKYTKDKCFEIRIQTDEKIFSSQKHIDRWKEVYSKPKRYIRKRSHVYVESIEWIKKDDARCILIDDPLHLYIAGDFLTTHNSFGAVLSVAEPSDDGNFRGLFLRNNLGDLRSGGGLLDNFREAFGDYIEIVESGEPRVTFPSGARIDVTHVSDQTREKVLQRFKGRQYDFIYFDELTGFTFECFAAICTRNRGRGKWTGKIRATTNPMRKCWIRDFIDWYIGADGFIREDRAGVIRYFYMSGETVKDVVWGDSKEEVYAKCRIDIDRKLAKINGKTGTATYENLIKSFTFYLGKMTENKAMLSNNDDYVGSVAMMGGRNAQQLLEGNWNVDPEEDLEAIIPSEMAMQCFLNDPQTNGDKWITCDLADTGTDNFIALAWDGFHIIDILIVGLSTPRQNAEMLHNFAVKHDIADDHIIYDAIRGTYVNDYIRDAVQFVSYRAPMGMYGRGYVKLKDECYGRLIEAIRRGGLSFADELQNKRYEHANLDAFVSIENEFVEECSVVRYDTTAGGKKTLWSKKKMNQKLGKNRSMDLLDPCAMRMLPVLEYAYGEELIKTSTFDVYTPEEYDGLGQPNVCNIFDDTMFC
jgi:hypothetical protein